VHETIRGSRIESLEKNQNMKVFTNYHIGNLTSIQLHYLEMRELETVDHSTRGGFDITPDMSPKDLVNGLKGMVE
jgi:hypothetical protein